jgi:branched-chain amino acid transport system ATP-binding protein
MRSFLMPFFPKDLKISVKLRAQDMWLNFGGVSALSGVSFDVSSQDSPSVLVREIFGIIKKINRQERTSTLPVEQNAKIALCTSDYGYIMENGRIVLNGLSPKLEENEDIKEFYLWLTQVGKRKSFQNVKHDRRRKRWLS